MVSLALLTTPLLPDKYFKTNSWPILKKYFKTNSWPILKFLKIVIDN